MSKHFRPWNIDQTLLLPPNVRDFVPKDHVSRFIVGLVRESLDLKAIMCSYVSGLGQPPFDPRMMVSLLLHGYASGLYSSRRIARACSERNDFVMIVALDPPDFRTISDFRKRHLKALGELFLQVLKLCETAGLVKLGHVALDGTKIKANASKHKAMSYERMKKREAELKAEVACMLAAAEAADMRLLDEANDLKLLRCGEPHVWSPPSAIMLFEQPQFERLLGDNFLQVLRLAPELLDFIGRRGPRRVAGAPALAGLQELLRPRVIHALGDAFASAKLGD